MARNTQHATRNTRQSQIANRKSREGIALIVTLILLSVTLVMAIAFLALSRRERDSVSLATDSATAKFAADSALAHAEAQIVSQMLGTTNPYVFGLLVSTNYINGFGFNPNANPNPTNVNYDHEAPPPAGNSGPLSQGDFQQNVANLFYYPRPPVIYGSNDFRFYLDLNRNGEYDTNGVVTNVDNRLNGLGSTSVQIGDPEWIGILEHPDAPHGPDNPFIARYCFIAVPANSLDLNYIHNQAFNYAQATVNQPVSTRDGYYRNQGVGTWELNLAAFLADLNTNRWDPPTLWNSSLESYSYPQAAALDSVPFDDARALIAWRYNNLYPLQASAESLFGWSPAAPDNDPFIYNGIDYYGVGQQTNFDANYFPYYLANNFPSYPWPGAVNTNQFFTLPSDLFNTNKAYQGPLINPQIGYSQFATNLYSAGINNATYDRYTFYRMLGQLGTDTLPASGKINLNYSNAIVNFDFNAADITAYGSAITNVATSITIVPNAETNFMLWRPGDFFTVAANQLLRAYTTAWYESSPSNYIQTYFGFADPYATNLDGLGLTNVVYGQTNQIPAFGITNIPVYVNGSFVYTPAVNRLLQLAANMYDASTNNANFALGMSNYPSVFRPVFWAVTATNPASFIYANVYIKGYQYVTEPLTGQPIFTPPLEVNDPIILNLASRVGGGLNNSNVWGVPWIIGAKKGMPNFNGLEVDNTFYVERDLEFNRHNANTSTFSPTTSFATIAASEVITTNQMYKMGVINTFGMEDWNSYANNYYNGVNIYAQENFGFALSNLDNLNFDTGVGGLTQVQTMFSATNLPNGYAASSPGNYSWPGYSPSTSPSSLSSFILPLGTNVVLQNLAPTGSIPATNGLYMYFYGNGFPATNLNGFTYNPPCFIPTTVSPANFMDQGTPPLPHLVMVTTNRVQAWMLDYGPNGPSANSKPYILDYVQLGGMNSSLDVNQAISTYDTAGLFSTNTIADGAQSGMDQQYLINLGSIQAPPYSAWPDTDPLKPQAIADFQAFFSYDNAGIYKGVPVENFTNLSIEATPVTIAIVNKFVYQANDPLVHSLASDLTDFADFTTNTIKPLLIQGAFQSVQQSNQVFQYLGKLSDRYMPWGSPNLVPGTFVINNQIVPTDANLYKNPYNLSYKDPLVWQSDNWDFPSYKYPTVGWLGRVHRGTPWQTVFLKSTNLLSLAINGYASSGLATWQLFTGNVFNSDDASNTAPVWDRLLFDLFTATPDDDATRGQVNVNIGVNDTNNVLAGLASWSALLSGTLAFSNTVTHNDWSFHPQNYPNYYGYQSPIAGQKLPYYAVVTNQPLGAPPIGGYPGPYLPVGTITNSPMFQIVQGINQTRNSFVNIDGLSGAFEHVGDILSTPQLSDDSPYLQLLYNGSIDPNQLQYGISDEMYEWMPQQMLGLMTVSGTPQAPQRYVVYCYGQTLKPAPNGIVSSGTFFGLITNYQVTAESAARAVIRVVNAPNPANPTATPSVVIEQFNPLPPD